ncbi:hypothetical protein LQ938_10870 [Microbacterium sp. cx-55]|uniref:hypothetical protein n=1 Tax=unclassified Microbacterium TaxID=2609290 RepID=UPI001CC187BD|nr:MULTISPECIES: hypothetical protein [unclassified Microbacterium]MBZ4485737.1 hypothetical protein [Microbacterium sp. cx-55]MCC4906699.1 hypothetical protein [Microbacterium sp. cx-59]UGB34376.1 hypothetical protein LQ938_10870 [Microbacterium sp. cx-55]
MMASLGGWHILILLGYVLVIALIVVVAALAVRWAVLSALKAHTRWVDAGKP